MSVRGLVAAAMLVVGTGVPVDASGPVRFACSAEVSPRVVSAGATDQRFTLTVRNGPDLPSVFSVEEINLLRIQAPYDLPDWPPIAVVLPTSAGGPSPWTARVVGNPPMILYEQGRISLGSRTTFWTVADITDHRGTFEWIVEASRDEGRTLQFCSPEFPGALDITVT